MQSLPRGGGVSIIEFTVRSSGESSSFTYQCEDGMTWQEFVKSSYNTNNDFSLTNDGYVSYVKSSKSAIDLELVLSTEKIVADNIYYYLTSGGVNYIWKTY